MANSTSINHQKQNYLFENAKTYLNVQNVLITLTFTPWSQVF